MTLENLVIDWDASLHNTKENSGLIAVGIKETYEYNGSQRTNRIVGYSVEVVDTMNRFEKTSVKVGVTEKPFEVDNNDEYLNVFFVNLKGKAYMDYNSHSVKFSLTADRVQVLNNN